MNLVDLFAIVPFFLDLIIGGLQVRKKERKKDKKERKKERKKEAEKVLLLS